MRQLKLDFKGERCINIGWDLTDLYNVDLSKHITLMLELIFLILEGEIRRVG